MADSSRRPDVIEMATRGDIQRNPSTRARSIVTRRERSDEGLAAEAARYRHERNEARQALAEANRMLLGMYLHDRLRDPGDFELLVGMRAVVGPRGSILWDRVGLLVDELLAVKPHLAAAPDGMPLRGGVSAVEWFTNQPV